jgi:hypothetical protein
VSPDRPSHALGIARARGGSGHPVCPRRRARSIRAAARLAVLPPGQSWPGTQFPDGSGSIALPPGGRLNGARQAAAELQGPRGEAVAVGITMPIGPPQFSTPGSLAAPYMPPAEAYAWVSEVLARRSGAQARIVEMVPTPPLTQTARAANVLADQITQGRRYRSFALVNTAMLGNGYWQYYMTLLTAPVEIFPQALPLMTEVWLSWSISQGEMTST